VLKNKKNKGEVDSCSPLRARQISPATPVGVRAGETFTNQRALCPFAEALPVHQGWTCPLEVLGNFGLPIATQNVSGDTFCVAVASSIKAHLIARRRSATTTTGTGEPANPSPMGVLMGTFKDRKWMDWLMGWWCPVLAGKSSGPRKATRL